MPPPPDCNSRVPSDPRKGPFFAPRAKIAATLLWRRGLGESDKGQTTKGEKETTISSKKLTLKARVEGPLSLLLPASVWKVEEKDKTPTWAEGKEEKGKGF